AILTGVYPPSTGSEHMRSDVNLPPFMDGYPVFLREAGYYTTNNDKEDYNVTGHQPVWDESSEDAHYRNREEAQPFFAVFNFTESHEYALRSDRDTPHHDPDRVPVPSYHPDTPEVRRDWARYYQGISEIDQKVGEVLNELEEEGLADETIVFFYADHGSGMPRHKRWPYNSGLQVPLIVHVPEKYRHLAPQDYAPGSATNDPVAFVDLAPTLLSLTGLEPPDWMQGRAFMGEYAAEPGDYLHGFRGRMDERIDMVRSVRNGRYVYVRNYMPHRIYGQFLPYMFLTETTRVWQDLYNENELEPPKTYFWEPKPAEELYDLESDPDETMNLADSKLHREVLEELREAHREHVMKTRDAGFLPEAEMHRRAGGESIYEMAQDSSRYPLEKIFNIASLASSRDREALPELLDALDDEDPAVRYWAVTGIRVLGEYAFRDATGQIRNALTDENPSVQVVAAEVLVRYGNDDDIEAAAGKLLELAPPDKNGAFIGIAAMNVLERLDEHHIERISPFIKEMPLKDPNVPERPNEYVERLTKILLGEELY
ncbi:MAG: sulfatase-like hydrolase/transferase, partial [Balneolaceae bacterium]